MEKIIESKNRLAGYTNSLINKKIKSLCESYGDSQTTLCRSYKEILEENVLASIYYWRKF